MKKVAWGPSSVYAGKSHSESQHIKDVKERQARITFWERSTSFQRLLLAWRDPDQTLSAEYILGWDSGSRVYVPAHLRCEDNLYFCVVWVIFMCIYTRLGLWSTLSVRYIGLGLKYSFRVRYWAETLVCVDEFSLGKKKCNTHGCTSHDFFLKKKK